MNGDEAVMGAEPLGPLAHALRQILAYNELPEAVRGIAEQALGRVDEVEANSVALADEIALARERYAGLGVALDPLPLVRISGAGVQIGAWVPAPSAAAGIDTTGGERAR